MTEAALFPLVGWVLWRYARKPYLDAQRDKNIRWPLLAAIAGLFYLSIHMLWLDALSAPSGLRWLHGALLGMVLVMPATYLYIFLTLRLQRQSYEAEEREQLLAAQSRALSQRIEQSAEAERQVSIQRHDLRHRLNTTEDLLRRGDHRAALEYVRSAQDDPTDTELTRWCADPILDAMFSVYFAMAKARGIRVDSDLRFPDTLPVPAPALSLVIANALENAIHAVEKLPEARRELRCACFHTTLN